MMNNPTKPYSLIRTCQNNEHKSVSYTQKFLTFDQVMNTLHNIIDDCDRYSFVQHKMKVYDTHSGNVVYELYNVI